MNLFDTLSGAGGYFVPMLLLFAFLARKDIWDSWRRAVIGAIILYFILFCYLIKLYDTSVSRYFFMPIVLCCLFCGAGIVGIQRLLPRIAPRLVLVLLCVGICSGSLLQIVMRSRKSYLMDFAQIIQQYTLDGTQVILYGQHSDPYKIALMLKTQGMDCIAVSEEIPMKDFIFDTIIQKEWEQTEIFFLIGISRDEEPQCWIEEFRSLFYVAPFDLIGKSIFRKRKQLLFRFNRKIGDGVDSFINQIAKLTPQEISFNQNSLNSLQIQDNDRICRSGLFILPRSNIFSSMLYGMLRINGKGVPLKYLELNYCNTLFWPEVSLKFLPDDSETLIRQTAITPVQKAILPAEVPPLILAPTKIIFAENRKPNWKSLIVNRGVNGRYELEGKEEHGKFLGQIKDRISQLSSSFSIEIVRVPITALQDQKQNILILTTQDSSGMDFSSALSLLLGADSQVKKHVLGKGFSRSEENQKNLETELSKLPNMERPYNFILLDMFASNICGGDNFPFAADDFEEKLSRFISIIQEKYPQAQLLLLHPPAPVGECLYPRTANGRLNLLSHYRVIRFLEKFQANHEEFDLKSVVLYCSLDFDTDFTWERKFNAYATPLGIVPSAHKKIAEDIAANIVYQIEH